jgi:hypothetical protein
MNVRKSLSLRGAWLAVAACAAALVLAPGAQAAPIHIGFSGGGDSGWANLAVGTDTVAGDPAGAQAITGATGAFNGAAITGVLPVSPAGAMFPTELLPGSLSFLLPAGASYDNLYYAGGSPVVCLNINPDGSLSVAYPFSGGFLDIFGVMFTLDNGNLLGLWSNGVTPGGLTYGYSVLSPGDGGYVKDASGTLVASVPEPNFLWLLGAGLVGFFAWRRWLERRELTSAAN